MLAACISHFSRVISDHNAAAGEFCIIFGLEATPAFLLLSGVVIGYLGILRREPELEYRMRLFDRGIFLLIVAHFAIGLSQVGWHSSLYSVFLTDAIGVSLCVVGCIRRDLSARTLAVAGGCLYLLSWCIGTLWTPGTGLTRLFGLIVFGVHEHGAFDEQGVFSDRYVVPVLPYLGLFLMGVALGKSIAPMLANEGASRRLAKYCLLIGISAVACATVIRLSWPYLEANVSGQLAHALRLTVAPEQKLPPSPTYLLFFGGAALIVSGFAFFAVSVPSLKRWLEIPAVVGRASLFVFVLQYWCYYAVPRWVNVEAGYVWLWWLPVSLVLLWLAAWAWDRGQGNRWLTVGLRLGPSRAVIRA
jgi:hypothetical protein